MSGPRSALEELRTEDLACVSDQVLEQDFGELQKASEALEAERLRRLAEIHRRSAYRRDGYLSTSAWLVDRFGVSQATGQVRMARALDEMPSVRGALASGEISCSAVRVLVAAREAHPQRFADQEGILLDAARTLSVRQLQIAAAYWKQAADSENAAALRDQRRLHASKTLFGMLRVDGELDPETGETVLTALRAVQDSSARAESGPDPRSPAQRRADALGEICCRWLDSTPRPEVAGERPHVTVTIDLEALSGKPGAVSELDHVGPIHPETARRLACDASVSRIITRGKSEPLDVGRRSPVVPASLRRAVVARDGHCRFLGCNRPTRGAMRTTSCTGPTAAPPG